jgi:hypothetical protein
VSATPSIVSRASGWSTVRPHADQRHHELQQIRNAVPQLVQQELVFGGQRGRGAALLLHLFEVALERGRRPDHRQAGDREGAERDDLRRGSNGE